MIGGTDITSVTLSYTAWELAKQPALQSKVWQKLWEARSDSGQPHSTAILRPQPTSAIEQVRTTIGTTPQVTSKLVFCNSDLDKSTTVWRFS
jgi:hypothetical protein